MWRQEVGGGTTRQGVGVEEGAQRASLEVVVASDVKGRRHAPRCESEREEGCGGRGGERVDGLKSDEEKDVWREGVEHGMFW